MHSDLGIEGVIGIVPLDVGGLFSLGIGRLIDQTVVEE